MLCQLPWQDLPRAHQPVPSVQLLQPQQRLRVPLWEQSLQDTATVSPTEHSALLNSLQVCLRCF